MQTCKGCGGAGCKACANQQDTTPKIFLPIEPMGAVRTTQKAKSYDEKYKKYAAWKTHLGYMAQSRINYIPSGHAIILTDLTFYMPIPKSGKTSILVDGKRKSLKVYEGMPFIHTPDLDNLIKGLKDALNKIAWADDAPIYQYKGDPKKVYSEVPGIEFGIEIQDLF